MSRLGTRYRRLVQNASRTAILLLGIAAPTAAAASEPEGDTGPFFSHALRYGDGWECQRGYRRIERECIAVSLPPNAFLSAAGEGWTCNRGFAKAEGACAAIDVPANAMTMLKSGGYHIMVFDVNKLPEKGSTVPLTLSFEKAGEVKVKAIVGEPGDKHGH